MAAQELKVNRKHLVVMTYRPRRSQFDGVYGAKHSLPIDSMFTKHELTSSLLAGGKTGPGLRTKTTLPLKTCR